MKKGRRTVGTVAAGLILVLAAAPLVAQTPVPVILDTDIGDDIDDTWALAYLLRSPEVDLKTRTCRLTKNRATNAQPTWSPARNGSMPVPGCRNRAPRMIWK